MNIPIIESVLGIGEKLIERWFPDPAERDKRRLELLALAQSGDMQEIAERVKVITTEAKSESFLTSNWRPITMLVFVFIIGNNYILYPYLSLFMVEAPMLEIPPDMWQLLKIGLGGYVVGRSTEKAAGAIATAMSRGR